MSGISECVDCGKASKELDEFASCPDCGEKRDVRLLAEEITDEAVLQFLGHTCNHKHLSKEWADKCTNEREGKYEAFIEFTSGIIRKIKSEGNYRKVLADILKSRFEKEGG